MEPWRLLWYVLNIIYILCTCNKLAFLDIYRDMHVDIFFIYAYIYIIMIKWDEWDDMYELGCTLLWHSDFGFPRMVWRRCCSFIDTVGYVSSVQLDPGFQQASIDLQFGVIQATQLYDRYSTGWRCQVLLFYMNEYVLACFIQMNAYTHTCIYRHVCVYTCTYSCIDHLMISWWLIISTTLPRIELTTTPTRKTPSISIVFYRWISWFWQFSTRGATLGSRKIAGRCEKWIESFEPSGGEFDVCWDDGIRIKNAKKDIF